MASPSLLAQNQATYFGEKVSDEWCQRVYQNNFNCLLQLDADPSPLQHWLKQKETRLLGIYFESLLAFWIEHLPDKVLLAQNLVVGQPGLQIGEFDLLFKDKEWDQVVHWEAAVKFYLRFGEADDLWLGPNPRDSLQKKLNKVFNRQLRLSEHARGRQALLSKLGADKVVSQAFIKGYLFYPRSSDWQTSKVVADGISSQHLRGWWCRYKEIAAQLTSLEQGRRWLLPLRLERLAPILEVDNQRLMNDAEISEYLDAYFKEQYQARMLVELRCFEGVWQEVSRGFVVNQHWPK